MGSGRRSRRPRIARGWSWLAESGARFAGALAIGGALVLAAPAGAITFSAKPLPFSVASGYAGLYGLALDSAGDTFVTESAGDKVMELPANGGSAFQLPFPSSATGVARRAGGAGGGFVRRRRAPPTTTTAPWWSYRLAADRRSSCRSPALAPGRGGPRRTRVRLDGGPVRRQHWQHGPGVAGGWRRDLGGDPAVPEHRGGLARSAVRAGGHGHGGRVGRQRRPTTRSWSCPRVVRRRPW